MRKHRAYPTDSNKPVPPLPRPSPPTQSTVPPPFSPAPAVRAGGPLCAPRDRCDGPRSLPTKHLTGKWGLGSEAPSYSSLARVAGGAVHHSASQLPSVSVPPRVQGEGVEGGSASVLGGSCGVGTGRRGGAPGVENASLTRSDSLLNKARRVFSLPTSLKRRPALLDPEKRDRRRSAKKTGGAPTGHVPETGAEGGEREREREREREGREGEDRLQWLEDELEAARVRISRQRRRIAQLEEQVQRERQSRPPIETLVQSALRHFEAKERALKHTIERMDHDYAAVLAEKNEAMRLLTTFVGRGGRSPPASFSSVSEAGTDSWHYKASRRALSMDTVRRGSPSASVGARTQSGGMEFEPASDKAHE